MSQYDELQKAAAYAAQDTIKFADESEEMRAHQQFHEEIDPETVLALIADLDEARNGMKHSCAIRLKKRIELLETQRDQLIADNERLTKAVGLQVIRRFVGDDDQKNIDELVAAGIQVDKELIVQLKAENERLAAACERAEQIIIVECKAASLAKVRANLLEANRDELRAEISGLKTGYEAYERVSAELKAEVEGLRKELDARHPFKPFHEPAIGFTGCVICGAYTDHGGLPCPKTRASADAAMGKGERHERD